MSEEATQRCSNCRAQIAESKIMLHELYCERNCKKCETCGKFYDINDVEQHEEEFHKALNKPVPKPASTSIRDKPIEQPIAKQSVPQQQQPIQQQQPTRPDSKYQQREVVNQVKPKVDSQVVVDKYKAQGSTKYEAKDYDAKDYDAKDYAPRSYGAQGAQSGQQTKDQQANRFGARDQAVKVDSQQTKDQQREQALKDYAARGNQTGGRELQDLGYTYVAPTKDLRNPTAQTKPTDYFKNLDQPQPKTNQSRPSYEQQSKANEQQYKAPQNDQQYKAQSSYEQQYKAPNDQQYKPQSSYEQQYKAPSNDQQYKAQSSYQQQYKAPSQEVKKNTDFQQNPNPNQDYKARQTPNRMTDDHSPKPASYGNNKYSNQPCKIYNCIHKLEATNKPDPKAVKRPETAIAREIQAQMNNGDFMSHEDFGMTAEELEEQRIMQESWEDSQRQNKQIKKPTQTQQPVSKVNQNVSNSRPKPAQKDTYYDDDANDQIMQQIMQQSKNEK